MGNKIGVKGGKRDLKLFFRNMIRRRKKERIESELQKEKQEQEKKKKDSILIRKEKNTTEKEMVIGFDLIKPTEIPKPLVEILEQKRNTQKSTENSINKNNQDNSKKQESENIQSDSEKRIIENTEKQSLQSKLIDSSKFKKGKNLELENNSSIPHNNDFETREKKIDDDMNFIEKEIVEIINQEIEEKKFKLKKLDSEIYTIQKNLDTANNDLELLELEKQIQELLNKIEKIKKQISTLEKTLNLKFPIDNPDNYLIYLTEEYKNRKKDGIDFETNLKKDPEFKSIMDTLMELEREQEKVQQTLKEKEESLQLDQEKIEKLQDSMIDINDMNQRIVNMLEQSKRALDNITNKVNEAVQITEKVNYITKQVNHSLLELFLLMRLFKRNISIKNSAIAAATTATLLDMIIKMTTPIQETKVVKNIQLTDYKDMIKNCLSDTDFLENLLYQNLNEITSLRYTFEHEYKSCSYLPSYQEALKNLTNLEESMKEHKKNIAGIKKDMEYQLEKNNAKVKKYNSIN